MIRNAGIMRMEPTTIIEGPAADSVDQLAEHGSEYHRGEYDDRRGPARGREHVDDVVEHLGEEPSFGTARSSAVPISC
jgi:NADH:ubiquinone oxidoreductase subunit F (NADH-binding)